MGSSRDDILVFLASHQGDRLDNDEGYNFAKSTDLSYLTHFYHPFPIKLPMETVHDEQSGFLSVPSNLTR